MYDRLAIGPIPNIVLILTCSISLLVLCALSALRVFVAALCHASNTDAVIADC